MGDIADDVITYIYEYWDGEVPQTLEEAAREGQPLATFDVCQRAANAMGWNGDQDNLGAATVVRGVGLRAGVVTWSRARCAHPIFGLRVTGFWDHSGNFAFVYRRRGQPGEDEVWIGEGNIVPGQQLTFMSGPFPREAYAEVIHRVFGGPPPRADIPGMTSGVYPPMATGEVNLDELRTRLLLMENEKL